VSVGGEGGAFDAGAETGGAAGQGAGGASDPEPPFLDGFFPIAADYQPHASFDKWKKRGVNTMVRVPPDEDVGEWTKTANQLDLRMIRKPRSNPHDDVGESKLLAWHWMDEPELHGEAASKLKDFVDKMHAVDPKRPIHVNFWGGGILENPDDCYGSYCYPDYVDHADWISDDIYPCNKYACDISLVGKIVSKLRGWASGEQPAFAYIETSDWDGNGTGPSPRRFRAEVWDAIIHGARGVFYFCVRLKSGCTPGSGCLADYDATPSDVAEAMPALHQRLAALGPILQRHVNPKGISMDVPDALEVGWRQAADGTAYFIVQNPTDTDRNDQKLTLHGVGSAVSAKVVDESRSVKIGSDGIAHDDFEAYGVHIYRVE
jgi:hypothetical protein